MSNNQYKEETISCVDMYALGKSLVYLAVIGIPPIFFYYILFIIDKFNRHTFLRDSLALEILDFLFKISLAENCCHTGIPKIHEALYIIVNIQYTEYMRSVNK